MAKPLDLRELLCHLGAADFAAGEVSRYSVEDAADGATYIGEVRVAHKWTEVVCETIRMSPSGRREELCLLRATESRRAWSIDTFRITDRRLYSVDPRDALGFAWKMMATVATGKVPDTDAILFERLGLRLPIVGYW